METKVGDADSHVKMSTEAIGAEKKDMAATKPGGSVPVENAPDPDEDDLDDLDGMCWFALFSSQH